MWWWCPSHQTWQSNQLEFGISANCILVWCHCCLVMPWCLCFRSLCPIYFIHALAFHLAAWDGKKLAHCTGSFPTILVFHFKSNRNIFQFITILVPDSVSAVTIAVLISLAVLSNVVQLLKHVTLMELCISTSLPLFLQRRWQVAFQSVCPDKELIFSALTSGIHWHHRMVHQR